MKISRTTRLLAAFHFFLHCKEVFYSDLSEITGGGSYKTAYRDIVFLKQAGLIRAEYSKRTKSYIPVNSEFVPEPFENPVFPENETKKKYMEKIIRLCTLMTEMWGEEDPISWYRERYPKQRDRTRQRDFKELRAIGYDVYYVPAEESPDEKGYYEYDEPAGAYELIINGKKG